MEKSLIPVIGTGLGNLFGTATESDSNTIHSSVSKLEKGQEEMAHVLDEISW